MPLTPPTTQESIEQNLTVLETNVGQEAPLQEKALLRVLALSMAFSQTTGYKFGTQEALENLAITASREGLIDLGNEYGVSLKPAEAFQCTATIPAINGTQFFTNIDYVGVPNGARYNLDATVIAAGGLGTLQLTAQVLGSAGNLLVGDILNPSSLISGAENTATITVITNLGGDAEETESYRTRVLSKIRTQAGGGTSADYRNWGTEVVGVESIYPYAMRPDQVGGGNPGERTLFVEAETDIDPDGIAPQTILDDVRQAVQYDPITGLARNALGIVDSTLYVLSIARTSFFVEITDLDVSLDQEAQVKADIESGLTIYFLSIFPFIEGLDPAVSKNDIITDLTVSSIVQDVVGAAGGTATAVTFNDGGTPLPSYSMVAGEHAKLGATPTYV